MSEKKSKTGIPHPQRVFINRSLNFGNIKLIGFDMDHTLAPYDKENFETLAFQETLKKFIAAGYPEELTTLAYKHDFIIRGLMVDRERGNILRVDAHKYVKDAFHGYRRLSKDERHALYNKQSFRAQDFLSIDTFFALSEVQLFVDIVHYMETHPHKIQKSFVEVYADLRQFIDLCHRDGSIKSEVLRQPHKYIIRDKYLPMALIRLADAGKSLFLLTNSHYDYTDAIMSYVFDGTHGDFTHWKDYWDYIIVGSGKPGFFVGSQPFFEVMESSNLLKVHEGPLQTKAVYFGGNAKLFEKMTNFRGDEILYVGDHIYGDIIQSKGSVNWRTLLIVKELEAEIAKLEETQPFIQKINACREEKEAADEELQRVRSMMVANRRQWSKANQGGEEKKALALNAAYEKLELKCLEKKEKVKQLEKVLEALQRERAEKFHPLWGELMKVGPKRSRFANQVCSYACIYTSRVSNLRFYSPFKKFISFHERLPHEEEPASFINQ